MIDLDALKRWADHLAPYVEDDNQWYRDGGIDGKDAGEIGELFAELHAKLSQPVVPASDRAALVERMLNAAVHAPGGARIFLTPTTRGLTKPEWDAERLAAMDRALAAVEAAGWGPRPEAVTLEEQGRLIAKLSATPGVRGGKLAVNAVLTSDVLRSRGITVEGAK